MNFPRSFFSSSLEPLSPRTRAGKAGYLEQEQEKQGLKAMSKFLSYLENFATLVNDERLRRQQVRRRRQEKKRVTKEELTIVGPSH